MKKNCYDLTEIINLAHSDTVYSVKNDIIEILSRVANQPAIAPDLFKISLIF